MSLSKPGFSKWWRRIGEPTARRERVGKDGATCDIHIVVIDKNGPTPSDNWKQQLESIRWGGGGSVERAWELLKTITGPKRITEDLEDEEDNQDSKALFVTYTPARLTGGTPHPAAIVESTSMPAVQLTAITYRPHLSREIIRRAARAPRPDSNSCGPSLMSVVQALSLAKTQMRAGPNSSWHSHQNRACLDAQSRQP